MAKPWPGYELQGLLAREVSYGKLILPVWHNVTKDDIIRFSPSLADKVALDSSKQSIGAIALKILEVLNPDHYAQLGRYIAFRKSLNAQPVEWTRLDQLRADGPIVHQAPPEAVLRRLRIVHHTLLPVREIPWEKMVQEFQRDHLLIRELEIWERIASTFLSIMARHSITLDQTKELYRALLGWSMAMPKHDRLFVQNSYPEWLGDAYWLFHNSLPLDREPLD